MLAARIYQLLADLILTLHAGVVVFVAAGLVLILVGNWRGWRWVNRLWFRLVHLATITFVAVQSWFGFTCPLTTLENWLRAQAAVETYGGGFIEHWLQRMLFYSAPAWVFVTGYTLFGLLVAFTWWRFPPACGEPLGGAGNRHNRPDRPSPSIARRPAA